MLTSTPKQPQQHYHKSFASPRSVDCIPVTTSMATTIDPSTGRTIDLPFDAIQRVLFIHPKVHCYAVPPLTSNKGYTAAQWTTRDPIFTARVRVIETAAPSSSTTPNETIYTNILLEDASSGELFAGAPYTSSVIVEQCMDSSRFFAIRVVGEGGRKATLGIGFEERPDAFDFGIALQDAAKVLGFDKVQPGQRVGSGQRSEIAAKENDVKKDYSLKEGQEITIKMPSRVVGRVEENGAGGGDGALSFLPPPPSASQVKKDMNDAFGGPPPAKTPTAEELGFDDGEFGEFQ